MISYWQPNGAYPRCGDDAGSDDQLGRYCFTDLAGVLDSSAFRVSACFTALALPVLVSSHYARVSPAIMNLLDERTSILEADRIDGLFHEHHIDPKGRQVIPETACGVFNFLLRGPAARTGLFLFLKQPLPSDNGDFISYHNFFIG